MMLELNTRKTQRWSQKTWGLWNLVEVFIDLGVFLYILGLYEGNEFNWGGVKLGNLLNTSIERPIGLGCNMRHAAVVLWHPMHLCSEGDTVRCFWLCDLAHIRFRSSIDLWILPITINWPRQQD